MLACLMTGSNPGALAQSSMPGMDTSAPSAAPGKVSQSGAISALTVLSGKTFDRAFLSLMIPHHQAALEMARAVRPVSKDAAVKRWASSIIASQQAEIGTMTALLRSRGGQDAKLAAIDGMQGMAATVRRARDPDTAFVQGMLPHHSSAIDMANLALRKSADPAVLKLAQNIVLAQAKEMYGFRIWLLKN